MLAWVVALSLAADCASQGEKTAAAVSKGLAQMGNNLRAQMPAEPMVARVRKLVDDGMVCTHEHRQRAAFVLMRGDPEDLEVAGRLAREVYEAVQDANSGRMAAQAMDLAETRRGRPQRYGVLTATVAGEPCIYSWDPGFTDAQRAELGIPPLQDLLAAFQETAAYDGPLELEALQAAKRLCDRQEEIVEEVPEPVPVFQPQPSSQPADGSAP